MKTPANQVELLHTTYACGHETDIKVSPTTGAQNRRLILQETKRKLCPACQRQKDKKSRIGR
jgi:hypothetical protein